MPARHRGPAWAEGDEMIAATSPAWAPSRGSPGTEMGPAAVNLLALRLLSVPTDALSLYARVRGIRRRRATRRRSRRAANRATALRAAHTTRPIMVPPHIAGIVPATNPWSRWNLAAAPSLR
jgi:hypothetical protein